MMLILRLGQVDGVKGSGGRASRHLVSAVLIAAGVVGRQSVRASPENASPSGVELRCLEKMQVNAQRKTAPAAQRASPSRRPVIRSEGDRVCRRKEQELVCRTELMCPSVPRLPRLEAGNSAEPSVESSLDARRAVRLSRNTKLSSRQRPAGHGKY